MARVIKVVGWAVASQILIIVTYLLAALVGGLIPASLNEVQADRAKLEKPIYLISNMLHADIAIPLNSLSLTQFAFLRDADFQLDNPALEYLVIGWGSEAFYTSTKEYSDIEASTVMRAVTGDNSVMHVAPAGRLSEADGLVELEITEEGFSKLLEFIEASFAKEDGKPKLIPGASFGFGDVFYKSPGHFNVLNPCNIWVAQALSEAGLASGIWTPTTYSLLLNTYLYNRVE